MSKSNSSSASEVSVTPDLAGRREQLAPAPASVGKSFCERLYAVVDEGATDDVVRWLDDGDGFVVYDASLFARAVYALSRVASCIQRD